MFPRAIVIRRRLLQVALPVVLAAGGVWLYVSGSDDTGRPANPRQAGEAPPAPTVAAVSRAPTPAPLVPPAPREAARAVPAHPVEGVLESTPFRVDSAEIESGVLRLRQRAPAVVLELVLPGNPWVAPTGRHYEALAPGERAPDTPLVRVRTAAGARAYSDRVTLWLEFGRERDGALPGRLHLALPDAAGSRVAGTFRAAIRGFRFIDGVPDLSADSVGTLEYLALREILREDPQAALPGLALRGGRLVPAREGRAAAGYLEVRYRAGTTYVTRAFRFVKENARWRVHEQVRAGASGAPTKKPRTRVRGSFRSPGAGGDARAASPPSPASPWDPSRTRTPPTAPRSAF